MRKTEKKMVEVEITTYSCDFCDYSTIDNGGCCGVSPVMQCELCGKDACRNHRKSYFEFGSDYPEIVVCKDCNRSFEDCWEEAKEICIENEDIFIKEEAKERFFK